MKTKLTNITAIILFIVIAFCSCKESEYDISIGQYTKFIDTGKYNLRTYVCLFWGGNIPKFTYFSQDQIYPYGTDITGTFEYIKEQKPKEYKKAEDFVKHNEKRLWDSIYTAIHSFDKFNDSIKLLNSIKP